MAVPSDRPKEEIERMGEAARRPAWGSRHQVPSPSSWKTNEELVSIAAFEKYLAARHAPARSSRFMRIREGGKNCVMSIAL